MNSNTEKSHALLSASGSHRWMACPRSALFSLEFPPSVSSKYAEEGTKAHSLAEAMLQNLVIDWEYSDEMLKNVMVYVDYVREKAKGKNLSIEVSKDLKWLHPELKKGTADAVIREDLGDIEVVDLKYGAGVMIDPYQNPQLMMYALMATYDESLGTIDTSYENVIITIVQPRCGDEKIRSWKFSMHELLIFAETLRDCASEAMEKDAKFVSGEHCKWCPCAHACPELIKTTHEVIAADFDIIPDVATLNDEQVARVIKHKSVIKNFIEACETYAMSKLAIGEKVNGLKLVRGRGSRDWNAPLEEIEARLLDLTTPDLIYMSGLKSVAQIEKIIGKKAIEPLVAKVQGKLTVVEESDKREAVTVVSKDDFELLEVEP